MKTLIHKSEDRGHADHGWLNAHHSFSFANWYDPSKTHFGMLRVLNDDIVAAGQGFGMHPHNDMEIITIILEGALQHKDNMGNGSVIRPGDVQVMSAGTGVTHSEFNPSEDNSTNLFQLWIFPKETGIKPRYDQKTFSADDRKNKVQLVASGFKAPLPPEGGNAPSTNGRAGSAWESPSFGGIGEALYIHQDAALSLSKLEKGKSVNYTMAKPGNGAYIMVINGKVNIAGEALSKRDAMGVWEADSVEIKADEDAELLIVDVPMK